MAGKVVVPPHHRDHCGDAMSCRIAVLAASWRQRRAVTTVRAAPTRCPSRRSRSPARRRTRSPSPRRRSSSMPANCWRAGGGPHPGRPDRPRRSERQRAVVVAHRPGHAGVRRRDDRGLRRAALVRRGRHAHLRHVLSLVCRRHRHRWSLTRRSLGRDGGADELEPGHAAGGRREAHRRARDVRRDRAALRPRQPHHDLPPRRALAATRRSRARPALRAAASSTSPAARATCASISPGPATVPSRSTSAWGCCAPTTAARRGSRPTSSACPSRRPRWMASRVDSPCATSSTSTRSSSSWRGVLRPGGRIALLDVGTPHNGFVRWGHSWYFGHVVPRIGGLLSDGAAYRYLPRSVAYLPPPGRARRRAPAGGVPHRRAPRAERRHHAAPHRDPLMRAVTSPAGERPHRPRRCRPGRRLPVRARRRRARRPRCRRTCTRRRDPGAAGCDRSRRSRASRGSARWRSAGCRSNRANPVRWSCRRSSCASPPIDARG